VNELPWTSSPELREAPPRNVFYVGEKKSPQRGKRCGLVTIVD
jgi:hypothetical protein